MPDARAPSRDGSVTAGTRPAGQADPVPGACGPWRYGSVTAACGHCGGALPAGRSRRFCSGACRQAAYRRRGASTPPAAPPLPPGRSRTSAGVYECPGCGERLAGQRRCPDCHLFARRLGDGGPCTSCGEILTIAELLNIE
jgi:hypothetical protein